MKPYFSPLVTLFLNFLTIQCEKIIDPSLKPAEPFSGSSDAGILREELKKLPEKEDDDILAKTLWHRTLQQRIEIRDYYDANLCPKRIYVRRGYEYYYYDRGCLLASGLHEVSRDEVKKLYELAFIASEAILARTIYKATIDKWEEVGAVEEIVCANDEEMKTLIDRFYQSAYQDSVDNHLAVFRKDDKEYQQVMRQYCWKGLCQEKKIKPEDADKEAKLLRDIDPDKDKEGFKKKLLELLDNFCEPDLKTIFEKYRKEDDGINDAVDKAFDSDRVKRAYNRLVRYIENACKFYADELEAAVDGVGTDIDKINRIILTRCERDLMCILNKFKEIHGKTFTNRLKSDVLSNSLYLESIRYLCGKP